MQGRTRRFALVAGVIATLALAAPVGAITNGQPDAEEHPYVGQLFFYDADYVDSRFDDPGGWFNCSGTLIDDNDRPHRRPLHLRHRQGRRVHPARRAAVATTSG